MLTWRRLCIGVSANLVLATLLAFGLDLADRRFPPPLGHAGEVSREVLDADGQLLRAFATSEGRWRLKTTAGDVDPRFVRMLVAYEDQRFWYHRGVDPLALGRAAMQLVGHGRIVSGGSTLSMQVARLMEPREGRSFAVKL
ncbi:MAG: transglycosylase domain-containing protein, partial [Phyllobacterium sp.]